MQKQKLYVKYLKLKTIESEKTYKVYKNLFNKLIKKKNKKEFLHKTFIKMSRKYQEIVANNHGKKSVHFAR